MMFRDYNPIQYRGDFFTSASDTGNLVLVECQSPIPLNSPLTGKISQPRILKGQYAWIYCISGQWFLLHRNIGFSAAKTGNLPTVFNKLVLPKTKPIAHMSLCLRPIRDQSEVTPDEAAYPRTVAGMAEKKKSPIRIRQFIRENKLTPNLGKDDSEDMDLSPKEVFQACRVLCYANIPGWIWGVQGIGKSEVLRQVFVHFGVEDNFKDVRLSTKDPTEIRGYPWPNKETKKMMYLAPEYMPTDWKRLSGILFDEMNTSAPMTQNGALEVVLDRRVGENRLPDLCRVFAAGNPEDSGSFVHRLSLALANRFCHINMVAKYDSLKEYAQGMHLGQTHQEDFRPIPFKRMGMITMGFLELYPDLVCEKVTDWHERKDKGVARPRTLEYADHLYRVCDELGDVPERIRKALIIGCIGQDAGRQLNSYYKVIDEAPSVEEIFKYPKSIDVPADMNVLAVVGAAMVKHLAPENVDSFFTYVERCPEEMRVKIVKDAQRTKQEVLDVSPKYAKWCRQVADSLTGGGEQSDDKQEATG